MIGASFVLLALLSTIVLFGKGLVFEDASLLCAVFQGLLVNRLVLLFKGHHAPVDNRVVLKGHWPLLRILHINLLLLDSADPLRKFEVVGHSRGKHDDADMVWQLDDDLFPD